MALSLSSAFLTNVKAQFDSLNSVGERLAVEVPPKDEFADHRYSVRHKHGGQDNHIQGVQRIGDSNHLLISGAILMIILVQTFLSLDSQVKQPIPDHGGPILYTLAILNQLIP